jgi:iron-sulfur cluster assembly protein
VIHLSQSATDEVLRLMSKHPLPNVALRLGLQPSCCSSLSYALEFDGTIEPDDEVFTLERVTIVVSNKILRYLDGVSIDYSEDLMGGGFRFHNPNATQTCDCGNSFAVADTSTQLVETRIA